MPEIPVIHNIPFTHQIKLSRGWWHLQKTHDVANVIDLFLLRPELPEVVELLEEESEEVGELGLGIRSVGREDAEDLCERTCDERATEPVLVHEQGVVDQLAGVRLDGREVHSCLVVCLGKFLQLFIQALHIRESERWEVDHGWGVEFQD